jgi:internalin A
MGNQLTSLPPEIGQLSALTELRLYANRLNSLPPGIGTLSALNLLDLSSNKLTALPPEIGQISALRVLFLSNNQLSTVPPEIGQLSALTGLNLAGNQLTTLPKEIGRNSALTELFLHENPDLELPEELLGPSWNDVLLKKAPPATPHAILDYYFARQAQGEAAMQEVRVLLVGRGRVGKSSLLQRLQGRPFNPLEVETPGISVEKLSLECGPGTALAHVWDFGGQEFLHGTHQIFLSERCVYVLVLEGRESNWETETDYWLRFIQSFGGNSPVLVALNKYDQHPFSVDQHRLRERCPQIAGFVPTDAETGMGVEQLRGLLAQTVEGIRDVWLGVPRKWHAVKEDLEAMPEKFLEYRTYQTLCEKHGVTETQQQDSLAVTLHRLGIALNFRDHHRLRHTSVLKPQWITEAIYGLIRFTQKQDCHGVLHEDWLGEALQPAADYPPERHGFVLDLMAKFEVAFPLEEHGNTPARGTRWLIPELLGESQPEAFAQFRGEGVRRLRFTYPDALPPGLLPRLIVRTHGMSEAHPDWRWRSGVVLEWQGCQALVRLDRLQRQTEVAVIEGPLPDQQSLFDIIRAHLIVLHGKVRVVEETEVEGHPGTWVKVEKLRRKEREQAAEVEEETEDGEPVMVPVSETLDQVESDAATAAAGPAPPQRMRLFISYAHDNEKELQPVRQHLTLLGQRGYIQVWHDRDLVAGEKWETGIKEELNRADIVLLFYTTKARVSKFIQETELPIALDRADRGECTVIWVPLERKDLDATHPHEQRLKALQCATRDAQPIMDFDYPSKGWLQVEDSIRRAVEKRRAAV